MAMFANNLSTLGVSAAQIDNRLDTQSYLVQWLPTTGEFGLWDTFGDYDDHEKVATRLGVHYTHSLEDKQSQPGTEGIENSQIRLTDGSVIFTPDLFGPGITVNEVDYRMSSVDARRQVQGPVARGRVLLALVEQLHRRQHRRHRRHQRPRLPAAGVGDGRAQERSSCTSATSQDLRPATATRGKCAAARTGTPMKERGIRLNGEWMYVDRSPGRIHRVSVPGRRQGHGVPHQSRDELLSRGEVHSESRRPSFSLGGSASRRCASRRWSCPRRAQPLARAGAGIGDNEFNDSHFHLTNYIQQGIDVREFLQIMGTRVGRSTLFGIPLQQQWSYAQLRRLRADLLPADATRRSTTTRSPTPTSRASTARSRRRSRRASTR